jgi:hypothetical protein
MQPVRMLLIDEGGFQRELSDDSMSLVPGQEVVWTYRPQRRRREVYLVAAEVVQVSSLRVRIRVRTASGEPMLRWVHAKNLRARVPDEPAYPYPEPS